jgi:hypothetical protein
MNYKKTAALICLAIIYLFQPAASKLILNLATASSDSCLKLKTSLVQKLNWYRNNIYRFAIHVLTVFQ